MPHALDLTATEAIAAAGVSLRREAEGDVPFLRALYASGRAAELDRTGWDAAMRDAFVDHQFAAQQHFLSQHRRDADRLIVMRDGLPIGRLYLDRTTPTWRLIELALMTDRTGQGLGAGLIAWVLATARTHGADGIDLHVLRDNPRAAAFYTRAGFVPVVSDHAERWRMRHDLQANTAS